MAKTIAAQIKTVRREMEKRPAGLVEHVRRVRHEALDLAKWWDADPARAELAVWGHDLFRAHLPRDQVRLAREAGVPVGVADLASPVMLHGPIAAAVLRERFGITDDEVLEAVRDHTVGLGAMPMLGKIILIADKVEPRKRRRAPQLRLIRCAARRDLDLALLCWADWKWAEERARGWDSHPSHWAARLEWVREHHLDHPLPGRTEEELEAELEAEPAATGA